MRRCSALLGEKRHLLDRRSALRSLERHTNQSSDARRHKSHVMNHVGPAPSRAIAGFASGGTEYHEFVACGVVLTHEDATANDPLGYRMNRSIVLGCFSAATSYHPCVRGRRVAQVLYRYATSAEIDVTVISAKVSKRCPFKD